MFEKLGSFNCFVVVSMVVKGGSDNFQFRLMSMKSYNSPFFHSIPNSFLVFAFFFVAQEKKSSKIAFFFIAMKKNGFFFPIVKKKMDFFPLFFLKLNFKNLKVVLEAAETVV